MYTLYTATNKHNGSQYVGVTGRGIETRRRWHAAEAKKSRSSGFVFHKAIRKYGIETFDFVSVKKCADVAEAFREEIALIHKLKPRYNSTLGGGGRLGGGFSPEGLERIAASKRGNTWRRGIPHTPEVIERLRELGKRDLSKWLQRSHMGPKAQMKPVVCLDDGRQFESASAAAKFYGVVKSSLTEVCLRSPRRKTVGGRVFRYFGDHLGGADEARREGLLAKKGKSESSMKLRKPVICNEDGQFYDSAKEAALVYGIHRSEINAVCRGDRHSAHNLTFRYG